MTEQNTTTAGARTQQRHTPGPFILEQANGQTTIYDAKLNVVFRVDGRYFDALEPFVEAANAAQSLRDSIAKAERRAE